MAISKKIRHRLIDTGVRLTGQTSLKQLLSEAGVDYSTIVLEGSENTRWFNVVEFLEDNPNQLDQLLLNMIKKFPGAKELENIREEIAKSSVQSLAAHLKSIIDNNKCVLFIGPESLRCVEGQKLLSFNRFFSRQLADNLETLKIFYEKDQKENLSYIIDRYETYEKFAPGDTETFASNIYDPNQIMHIYKNLKTSKFPLIINTNPDTIFQDLLKENCISLFYDMTNTNKKPFPKVIDKPIVYNIYGSFEQPYSILFTEKEAVEFTKNAYKNNPPIPYEITNIVEQSYGFFIGFDFKEWHLKILFDVLNLKNKPGNYALSDSTISESDKEYYERQYNMTFVKNDIVSFLKQI